MSAIPTYELENLLWDEGARWVAGLDEVGRGSLAGPVCVGAVCLGVTMRHEQPPAQLRDSKLLAPKTRERLIDPLQDWLRAGGGCYGLGWASAQEIDSGGIVAALRSAALRAIAALPQQPEAIILDGSHNYVRAPAGLALVGDEEGEGSTGAAGGAMGEGQAGGAGAAGPAQAVAAVGPAWASQVADLVCTRVKADRDCVSVAAASVLAKCARDALMAELDAQFPAYGWAVNKGYGTAAHRAAIHEHGPCPLHRQSWHLF